MMTIKTYRLLLYYLLIWLTPLVNYCYIDVVIPCHSKDCETLELCIEGIKKYGRDIRRVIVVSDVKLSDNAEWFSESNYPFSLNDIRKRFKKIDRTYKKDTKKVARAGWYFQQLLKLYAPFVIPNISSNVLILDADTVFLKPVAFIDEAGIALYSFESEYNIPYFEHGAKLVPHFRKVFCHYSGIAHHMLFQKKILMNLFDDVERIHRKPFWKAFCDMVEKKDIIGSGASEYEIYFNYIFSRRYNVRLRKLTMTNLGDLKKIRYFQDLDYDYVSCHTYMRS